MIGKSRTIDQLWNEMNAPVATKRTLIINRVLSNTQIQNPPVDPNSSKSLTASSDASFTASTLSIEVLTLSNDILQWANLDVTNNNDNSAPDNLEDSDDDSEDEKEDIHDDDHSIPNQNRLYFHKIQRILNSLRSDCKKDRILSLQSIELSIQTLSKEANVYIEPLNFPPPYDISSVTMKYQSGLVSDLSTDSWPLWNQCQAPLISQFRKAETMERHGLETGPITQLHELLKVQALYNTFAGELCHRLSDESEQCRTLAIHCMELFCNNGVYLEKHLHYLMRSILSKFQPIFHDETLNVFVYHVREHEFFKRGGAIQRQDRTTLLHGESFVSMKEGCEEIRFQICHLISSLIRCSVHNRSLKSLHPYVVDLFLAVQSYLSDPFPDLKVAASTLLVQLLRIPQMESIAKHFAIAIARVVITNMRHRNTKVRLSAMNLFEAAISVPDRDKFKGAGTNAILDLLGFREENILPVAAFYMSECSVSINALAELSMSENLAVRLRCCQMLHFILTCIPNRHEFHQRILPYILVFHYDDSADMRTLALSTILLCGQQYESEHPDDIVERYQLGIDGDNRCNHQDMLPAPFTARPTLGSRMFVRENTRRILEATLKELCNWNEKVRLASIKLLQVLVIYNEEHMTMNFHSTLDAITKAIQTSLRETMDVTCPYLENLFHITQIIGRFVDPDVYLNLTLPRIVGDVSSATSICEGGFHPDISRYSYTLVLNKMILGSSLEALASHIINIAVTLLSDANMGYFTGSRIQIESLNILITLLDRYRLRHDNDRESKSHIQNEDGTVVTLKDCVERLNYVLGTSIEMLPEHLQITVQRINDTQT